MQLYTPDGEQIDVDEKAAVVGLQEGRLMAHRDTRYAIIGPEGKAFTIAGVEIPKAVNAGYRFATPEEVNEAKFGDENAAAFGAGVARGLTFGVSDMVMTQSGLVKPETLESLKEANPVMSIGGEAAGAVGSLLIPGGLLAKGGLAAKALTVAPRSVASLGAQTAFKAEGAILRLLTGGAKAGRLASAAAKTGAFAAAGAVEGSLYGIGQGVSEVALGDPETTGEAVFGILGNAATGALIGGAVGGLLTPAAELTGVSLDLMTHRALRKIKKYAGVGAMVAEIAPTAKAAGILRSLQQVLEKGSARADQAIKRFVSGIESEGVRKVTAPVITAPINTLLEATKTRDSKTAAKRYSQRLSAVMSDPVALADSISAAVADIEPCAPELAKSIATSHARAVEFLQTKAPKPPTDSHLQPQVDNWAVSESEARKFGRYANAALDPLSVVEDLASGSVTSEGPETLETVYPGLYALLKAQVLTSVAESKNPLSYGARVALSIFLGAPVERQLTRGYINRAQQIYLAAKTEENRPNTGALSQTQQNDTFKLLAPQSLQVQRTLLG